jgi:hypothetical protein
MTTCAPAMTLGGGATLAYDARGSGGGPGGGTGA